MSIPVYLFTGFLDAGKTAFIQETLEDPGFNTGEKTLVLLCEEGENEYRPERFAGGNVSFLPVEEQAGLTTAFLKDYQKKHRVDRVLIEYNGMWNFKNMKLPWHWSVEQQITTIDASTFPMYYTNMRSLLAEMLRKSEMIIFNRCDGLTDQLASYRRNVKAVNPQAEIIFEDSQGEVNQIFEEDLPYKLDAPIIELDNEGFGIWYLDCMDNLDRYIGKTIQFVGMVLIPEEFPEGYFIPGRMAMTCCAEDMAFLGFACEYDKTNTLTNKQWVKVTAKVTKEYFADYGGEGPVLKAVRVEQTKKPKEEVISFN